MFEEDEFGLELPVETELENIDQEALLREAKRLRLAQANAELAALLQPLQPEQVPDLLTPSDIAPDVSVSESGIPQITVRPPQDGAQYAPVPLPVMPTPEPEPEIEPVPLPAPRPPVTIPRIEPYEFLASRAGSAVGVSGTDKAFAERLASAIMEAEAATKSKAVIRDLHRDPARQAQYYANYTGRAITYNGVTYQPQRQGGLAAPPGQSRHQRGAASDIQRGAVLDWMHRNQDHLLKRYGLEFLKGSAFQRDPVHIQMARGAGAMPEGYQALLGKPKPFVPEPEVPASVASVPLPKARTAQLSPSRGGAGRALEQSVEGTIELPEITVTPAQELEELVASVPGDDQDDLKKRLAQLLDVPMQDVPQMPIAEPAAQAEEARQRAAQRVRTAARPEEGRLEGALTHGIEGTVIPKTPLDAAMIGATMIPGIGPATRLGVLTAGMVMHDFGTEAEAKPTRSKMSPEEKQRRAEEKKAALHLKQKTAAQPQVDVVVQSIAGPTKIKHDEFLAIGALGAMTIGALAMPKAAKWIMSKQVPKFRSVQDAVPGTQAISSNLDYARTQDNYSAGLTNILAKAGSPLNVVEKVSKVFPFQTRGAAHDLVNSGIVNGHFESAFFTYRSKVPIANLAKFDSPDVRQYLYLRHTADDLMYRQSGMSKAKLSQAGPPKTKDGQDIQAVLSDIGTMERANPVLRDVSKNVREIIRAERHFQSVGEYATISKGQANKLQQTRPNTLPYVSHTAALEQNPFDLLSKSLHKTAVARMENEAAGTYINALRAADSSLAKYSPKDTAKPEWAKNTVTFKQRGVPMSYTTDPLIATTLKSDPYAVNMTGNVMYGASKIFTAQTTGKYAPWFADTSLMRSWHQAKLTTPEGYRSPTLIGSAMAIPQQVYPRMAKSMSEILDNGSGKWLSTMFGPSAIQGASLRLAKVYDDSVYGQLQHFGGGQGAPFMHSPQEAKWKIMRMLEGTDIPRWYQPVAALIDTIHNAPAHNFVKRNMRNASLKELAPLAKNLTGNPQTRGQYYIDQNNPIRIEGTNRIGHGLAKGYGYAMEKGREYSPWANIIQQSMARTAQRYWQNPIKFVRNAYMYTGLPAAGMYLGAVGLGNDPNGRSYADYMINGRSMSDRILYMYVPTPGRPVEEGLKFARSQELAGLSVLVETALDHLTRGITPEHAQYAFGSLTNSSVFSEGEDLAQAAKAAASVTISPPVNPMINFALGTQGMTGLFGVFGDTYKPREGQFSDVPTVGKSVELTARAIQPGLVDIVGTGASGYVNSDEKGFKAMLDGASAASMRMVRKSITGRNLFPDGPVHGNTRVVEEMYRKKKSIDKLERYYNASDETTAYVDSETGRPARGLSKSGLAVRDDPRLSLGERMPSSLAGITPPEPTNPLYIQFAETLKAKFGKDSLFDDKTNTPTGAIGFKSLLHEFTVANRHIETMRKVQDSNAVSWRAGMSDDQKQYLVRQKVNANDRAAVMTHYQQKRQDAARVIVHAIKSVELEMSKELGQAIRIEDIDPYEGSATQETEQPQAFQ